MDDFCGKLALAGALQKEDSPVGGMEIVLLFAVTDAQSQCSSFFIEKAAVNDRDCSGIFSPLESGARFALKHSEPLRCGAHGDDLSVSEDSRRVHRELAHLHSGRYKVPLRGIRRAALPRAQPEDSHQNKQNPEPP